MKENPKTVIIPRAEHGISRSLLSPNGVRVLYKLKEHGFTAYLVGGGVRDLLLGREPKDFDVATDATPTQLKKLFRNCRLIGRRFRLAHLHFHDEIIEVATFRSAMDPTAEPEEEAAEGAVAEAGDAEAAAEPESSPFPASILEEVPQQGLSNAAVSGEEGASGASKEEAEKLHEDRDHRRRRHRHHTLGPRMLKSEDGLVLRDNVFGTPEEDAVRRDFTVNALFYNVADFSIIDHVGGMEDLKNGLIRTIGDPMVRFTEDPVRMIRAIRFASMLGFNIEPETEAAIEELCGTINKATPPRLYEEVLKLLLLGAGERTYQLMRHSGLFQPLFPHFDNWLTRETDGFPHARVGKALEWADEQIARGISVSPSLLLALMFGEYLEEKIERFRDAGAPQQQAADMAVAEFAGELAPTVAVPNKVLLAVREIISSQYRFQKTPGRNAKGFVGRIVFPDALQYLRFMETIVPVKRSLADWWDRFANEQTGQVQGGTEGAAEEASEAPRKKKRRRRRRKKPAAAPEV
jgi:poly(A) polymerase